MLLTQDTGSNVDISLDGKKLEKNKEYQISVGQELKIGNDATYQVCLLSTTHDSSSDLHDGIYPAVFC